MKKQTYFYGSLFERVKAEYLLYLLAFVFILVSDTIGRKEIPLLTGKLIIFPIFFAIILGILSGPQVFKILDDKKVKAVGKLVIVAILPFIAKLGISAGAQIEVIIKAGLALLLQEFGSLGTIFLALPVALLLGLKREAVGACHSINRETNLALIQDVYSPNSPEARGSLSVYIIGGMVGTIYFGFMVSIIASMNIFHPFSLGMSSGVGAGIMMASAVASVSEIIPDMADQMAGLASASETLSSITGIYISLFIGIPLTNWLYKKWEPTLGRVTKAGRRAAAELEAAGVAVHAASANLEEKSAAAKKALADDSEDMGIISDELLGEEDKNASSQMKN